MDPDQTAPYVTYVEKPTRGASDKSLIVSSDLGLRCGQRLSAEDKSHS